MYRKLVAALAMSILRKQLTPRALPNHLLTLVETSKEHTMARPRLTAFAAALIASAVFLTACSTSAGEGSSSGSSSTGSALQEQAKAKVTGFENGPSQYPGPDTPIAPGLGRAAVLACGNSAPVCAQQATAAADALNRMGWDAPAPVDGQLSPQVQSAFIDRAVQDRLDGVILVAVDVNGIKASVERAADAGLIIMCTQCSSGPQWAGKVHDVTADFHAQGEMAAWKVIADKGDRAKIFGSQDDQFTSSVVKMTGLKDGITKNCPECKLDVLNLVVADSSKPGPPSFTAFLASHPQGAVDYFVPYYDGLSTVVSKTTKNSGRSDFLIGGFDGSPDGLNTLATANPPMSFDVAEPFTYEEWAAADLMARIKAGQPLWADYDRMPSTLITNNNVGHYLKAQPDSFPAPEGYQQKFLGLWGKA
jgi:ABC-type sugar transport system substrate-binding protein